MIDVSNPSQAQEVGLFFLEEKYAESIAEFESKALLVDEKKGILVIPVGLVNNPRFNGAFLFQIQGKSIALRLIVDHIIGLTDSFDIRGVERSFYIGDYLYTKSPCLIRVTNLKTLAGVINIPIPCDQASLSFYNSRAYIPGTTVAYRPSLVAQK